MQIRFILSSLVFSSLTQAAIVSRVTNFEDGNVLFASDLNSEFNNLVDNINALDNANIAAGANISPSKISATIAGDGIARNGSTGVLEVNDDNSTLEIVGDVLRVKDGGITNAKLRQSAALSVIGNATNSTSNVADITASSDGHVLRRSGTAIGFGTITTAGIADGAVTNAKLTASNYSLSSSCGLGIWFNNSFGLTFTDITNLSVTITTSGRPVEITALPTSSQSYWLAVGGSLGMGFRVLRNASTIAELDFQDSSRVSPSVVRTIDFPSAGTYTYKLQGRNLNSVTSVACLNIVLLAREL